MFLPTLKQNPLRWLTLMTVYYEYEIHQLDIKTAYLNSKLEEDIYVCTRRPWKVYKILLEIK